MANKIIEKTPYSAKLKQEKVISELQKYLGFIVNVGSIVFMAALCVELNMPIVNAFIGWLAISIVVWLLLDKVVSSFIDIKLEHIKFQLSFFVGGIGVLRYYKNESWKHSFSLFMLAMKKSKPLKIALSVTVISTIGELILSFVHSKYFKHIASIRSTLGTSKE